MLYKQLKKISEIKDKKSESNKKYRLKNLDKIKADSKIYYQNNKKKIKEKRRVYIANNKEKIKTTTKKYYLNHNDSIKKQKIKYNNDHKNQIHDNKKEYHLTHRNDIHRKKKIYYIKNRGKIINHIKIYRSKNKEKIRDYMRRYSFERRKRDINFRLLHRIRNRIYMALKHDHKLSHAIELLGCSINDLKEHLKYTAFKNNYKDFDINNFDGKKWHIDHIIPCYEFNLSDLEQQKKCFNYKNLQILTAKENLTKNKLSCQRI